MTRGQIDYVLTLVPRIRQFGRLSNAFRKVDEVVLELAGHGK